MKHRRHKTWFRFLTSYILILVLTASVGVYLYQHASVLLEQKEMDIRSLQVRECHENVDALLKKLDALVYNLSHSGMNDLVYMNGQPEAGSPAASTVYSVWRELHALTYADDAEAQNYTLLVYFNKADLVFDRNSLTYGRQWHYEHTASFSGMSWERFEAEVLNRFQYRNVFGNESLSSSMGDISGGSTVTDGMLYVTTLPFGGMPGSDRCLATVVIHINSHIADIFRSVSAGEGSAIYIATPSNEEIYGVYGDAFDRELVGDLTVPEGASGSYYADVGGCRTLVTYAQSDYNNWRYVALSPVDEIMRNLNAFQRAMTLAFSVMMGLGVLLSLLFSRRNSMPIENALRALSEYSALGESSPQTISTDIHNILTDNDNLNRMLKSQQAQMVNVICDRLLHGELNDDEELASTLRFLKLDFSCKATCAVLLAFGDPSTTRDEALYEKNLMQLYADRMRTRDLGFRVHTHALSFEWMCVLVFFDTDDKALCRQRIESSFGALLREFAEGFTERVFCCVGGLFDRITDLSLSLDEAVNGLPVMRAQPDAPALAFYQDLAARECEAFYPDEIRVKLKSLVELCKADDIRTLVDYLYTENFVKRRLQKRVAERLIWNLWADVIRISQAVGPTQPQDVPFRPEDGRRDYRAEFDEIAAAYLRLVDAIAVDTAMDNSVASEMLRFIAQNFQSPNMGVAMMEQQFHMSESYFSQYFKRNIGQVFSKYVENLRIERARALLAENGKSIDEIAAEVGYASTVSFRRAFKRLTGTLPSAFR